MTEKYYRVEMANGWCGFEDDFLVVRRDGKDFTIDDALDLYAYSEGGGGLNIGDGEDCDCTWDDYMADILDNSEFEEISKEDFLQLRDEELWPVHEF